MATGAELDEQSEGGKRSAEPHPKDGHLRLPNSLVEKFSTMRLTGSQWQILWTIWRRTLCWQKVGQWGSRAFPIGTADIAAATGIGERQIKREMRGLIAMNIVLRDNTTGGRGQKPMTAFNLDPSNWKVPPVEKRKGGKDDTLSPETPSEKGDTLATVSDRKMTPFRTQDDTLSVPNCKLLNKHLNKHNKETRGPSPQGLGAQTPASRYLFEKTGRKRWQNLVQKEQFEKAESEVGEERMKEAINWALTSGISNIKSIITAARRGKDGGARERTGLARPPASKTTGRLDKEPTPEEYIRSLPRTHQPGK